MTKKLETSGKKADNTLKNAQTKTGKAEIKSSKKISKKVISIPETPISVLMHSKNSDTPKSASKKPKTATETPKSLTKTSVSSTETPKSTAKTPKTTMKTPKSSTKSVTTTPASISKNLRSSSKFLKDPSAEDSPKLVSVKTPKTPKSGRVETKKTATDIPLKDAPEISRTLNAVSERIINAPETPKNITPSTPATTRKTPKSTTETPKSATKASLSSTKTLKSTTKTPKSVKTTPTNIRKNLRSASKFLNDPSKTPQEVLEIVSNSVKTLAKTPKTPKSGFVETEKTPTDISSKYNQEVPINIPETVNVVQKPIKNIYVKTPEKTLEVPINISETLKDVHEPISNVFVKTPSKSVKKTPEVSNNMNCTGSYQPRSVKKSVDLNCTRSIEVIYIENERSTPNNIVEEQSEKSSPKKRLTAPNHTLSFDSEIVVKKSKLSSTEDVIVEMDDVLEVSNPSSELPVDQQENMHDAHEDESTDPLCRISPILQNEDSQPAMMQQIQNLDPVPNKVALIDRNILDEAVEKLNGLERQSKNLECLKSLNTDLHYGYLRMLKDGKNDNLARNALNELYHKYHSIFNPRHFKAMIKFDFNAKPVFEFVPRAGLSAFEGIEDSFPFFQYYDKATLMLSELIYDEIYSFHLKNIRSIPRNY